MTKVTAASAASYPTHPNPQPVQQFAPLSVICGSKDEFSFHGFSKSCCSSGAVASCLLLSGRSLRVRLCLDGSSGDFPGKFPGERAAAPDVGAESGIRQRAGS
jgi:hypothetical protein